MQSVEVVFLTAVVVVAVRFGLTPSLAAVVGGSLCYNFFFLPPLYTFTIADPSNIAALFFFTVVAFLVSNLAARTRSDAVIAQGRARATEALYGFSRKLASCGNLDDVLWATVFQIASMLKVRVVVLLPEAGRIAVAAGYPPEDQLDEADIGAAKWCFDNNRAAGRSADTLPGAKRLFLPMNTGRGAIGVVGIDSDVPGPILTPERRRLLDALTDQGGLAIERVRLVEDLDRAKLLTETDRLRQALLTSISHDLRTPLASVLGAATTLRDLDGALDDASKVELLGTVIDEAERLNRFIANLLDMTRLEAGAVTPNFAEHDVGEIVDSALRRAGKILGAHQRRGRDRPRPADPGPRCGAVRAGPVQPPRQCREICPGGIDDPGADLAGSRTNLPAGARRGRRPAARGCRTDLRQVLPRPEGRPGPGRHGPRPRHRARLRRSHARHGRGHEPHGSQGRRLHLDVRSAPRPSTPEQRPMSMPATRILVIDDEPPIRKLLRMGLTSQGYHIQEAPDGKTALDLLGREKVDLVILDLGLPDMKGHELLRIIRERDETVPIVVLSSRGDERGKVEAFDLGADDYVTKPFGMNELLARLRAALRHQLAVQGERPIFKVDELTVDLVRRIVRMGDHDVKLSPKEYEVLRLLVLHAGKVLTHAHILREIWGSATDSQYLRVYVRQIRQKLEPDPERPRYILTETGVGYRLRAPD